MTKAQVIAEYLGHRLPEGSPAVSYSSIPSWGWLIYAIEDLRSYEVKGDLQIYLDKIDKALLFLDRESTFESLYEAIMHLKKLKDSTQLSCIQK